MNTALTPESLKRAIATARSHPTPQTLVRRVEQAANWCRGENATPIRFTHSADPCNVLVTLLLHDEQQWERVKAAILDGTTKQTWREHEAKDRSEYMRDYMREYRARKRDEG